MRGYGDSPMTAPALDIVAIGDAIVDVIATCDDAFLHAHGLPKGQMQLLSAGQADALSSAMGGARETSGGSAANTMAGVAAMGGRAAFIGQIADDPLGRIFADDLRALGVGFDTPPLGPGAPPTGRCLIFVTPDAQRTMSTCPGASHELRPQALDEALIRSAAILFLEGYLFGPDGPRATMARAVAIAHNAGRQVAFTLSESVCIAGRKESFSRMIDNHAIDLLFANEDELFQLTRRSDLDGALTEMAVKIPTLVVTRGPAGATAVEKGRRIDIPAAPLGRLVDTTGAGDQFAAGFLAARIKGAGLERQLFTGAIAAAEVIAHFGARPEADLTALVTL